MWRWANPVEVRFGEGVLKDLADVLPEGRVLVVTGRSSARKSGALDVIEEVLSGRDWKLYDGVLPEPTYEVAQEVVDFVRDYRPHVVVAVGGGSVLDVAKLASAMRDNPGKVRDLIGIKEPFDRKGAFTVAVPTTSGSGSEVTPFCVIMDRERYKKAPVTSRFCYPDVALDDPKLTYSCSKEVTVYAGVDALSHCIEAYLSKRANPVTTLFSVKGIELVFRYLRNAAEGDAYAKNRMMLASLYGGFAISNAGAGLVHQLGHALTFLRGYAHGLTMGIFLVPVLEFYGDRIRDKLSYLEGILGVKHFIFFLNRFLKDFGFPEVSQLNLSEQEMERAVNFVLSRKSIFEVLPVKVTEEDLRKLLAGE